MKRTPHRQLKSTLAAAILAAMPFTGASSAQATDRYWVAGRGDGLVCGRGNSAWTSSSGKLTELI